MNDALMGISAAIKAAHDAKATPVFYAWTGDDVKAFREDLGLSQERLAELCMVKRQTVKLWEERGAKPLRPQVSLILALVDASI